MSQPELAFLHIPKTAGTSQHQLFNRNYGRGKVFWFGNDCPGNIEKYPRKQIADRAVVGGHKPLSFYPRRYSPLYCAVIRKPLERAISLFSYYTRPNLARSPAERKERQKMLEGILVQGIDPGSMRNSLRKSKSFRALVSNKQCAYLSRSSASFSAVMKSFRRDDFVIGTLENYDRFNQTLSDLLNWTDDIPAVLNSSQENYARDFLADQELTALICELNAEDIKLHEFLIAEHDGLLVNINNQKKRLRRLNRLPLREKSDADPLPAWIKTGGQFWSTDNNSLTWPHSSAVLLEQYKILYAPIPGRVNNRVLTVLFKQSELEHKEAIRKLGMLRTIKKFNTGLMLKDLPIVDAESILADSSYYRFAVLTDPFQRLLDLYLEYFGQGQGTVTVIPDRLAASIVAQTGQDSSEANKGITFRQFVNYIVEQDVDTLEPAAKPQYLFIPDRDSFHRLYRENQLSELQRDWRELCNMPTQVANTASAGTVHTVWGSAAESASPSRALADSLPSDFPIDTVLERRDFADEQICDRIAHYYEHDYRLYNATFKENSEQVFNAVR